MMLTVFFDFQGLIHVKFLERGEASLLNVTVKDLEDIQVQSEKEKTQLV